MKTLEEIRARLAAILKEQRSMIDKAEKEGRGDLNEEETAAYDALEAEHNGLVKKEARLAILEEREKENSEVVRRFIPGEPNKDTRVSEGEKRDIGTFSFGKAVSLLVRNKPLDGVEKEMHEEGLKQYREQGLNVEGNFVVPQIVMANAAFESTEERARRQRIERRDLTAVTATEGAELVQTSVGSMIERLRSKVIVAQLGATQLNGLVGDIDFPVFGADDQAVEKGENVASAESSPTFTTKSISPNRLPVHAEYSRQLLIQAQNESIEAMLRDDLAYQIAKVMDTSAINGAGSGAVPEGILQTNGIGDAAGGTNGLAPTWDNVVTLETEVAQDDADVGNISYLTNAKVRGKCKRVFIDSGSGERIWDVRSPGSPLNGYNCGISNLVPSTLTKGSASGICSAMIFGNFRDLILAQWGGLEFLVNPYTLDTTGLIRLNAWTFYDVLIRRAESFAATQDILTT